MHPYSCCNDSQTHAKNAAIMLFLVKKIFNMGVSKNSGIPKSSILVGFSTINHPFWGTPIFGNTHMLSFYEHALDLKKTPSPP